MKKEYPIKLSDNTEIEKSIKNLFNSTNQICKSDLKKTLCQFQLRDQKKYLNFLITYLERNNKGRWDESIEMCKNLKETILKVKQSSKKKSVVDFDKLIELLSGINNVTNCGTDYLATFLYENFITPNGSTIKSLSKQILRYKGPVKR